MNEADVLRNWNQQAASCTSQYGLLDWIQVQQPTLVVTTHKVTYLTQNSVYQEDQHAKPCRKPWIHEVYNSSCPRPIKRPSISKQLSEGLQLVEKIMLKITKNATIL